MKTIASVLSLLSLACLASAQATAYSQCGGQNWTGATTCVSGWVCTYQNAYYSQCLQASSTSTTTTTLVTSVSSSSSSSSSTTTSASTTTSVVIPTSTNWAKTNGLLFDIDGTTKYYAGSNAYWLAFLANNSDVDHVLSDFYNSGLRIMRVWGFNDVNTVPSAGTVYFQLLQNGQATINTGADGLQHLDYVVASAASHGVKLIINFVNNWSDYGGIAAYNTAFGGNATSWYTDSASQAAYRNYIAAVVARYKNSDAVFAWELANEPRCHGCATSVITNWVASTSAYIKSLDPNHMVCIGDEGFGLTLDSDGSYPYTTEEGTDFAANIAINTIDFGTFHLYPDSWSVAESWGSSWVTSHGAACAAAGKPCLLEEYGVTSNKCAVEGPWQTTALGTSGIAGDSFWQYGDTISTSANSQGQSPNDGNTIYVGTSDYTCLVTDHVAAI